MDLTRNIPLVQQLRQREDLAVLPYEQQRQIIRRATELHFQQTPQWDSTDPEVRAQALSKVTQDIVPVFENPEYEQKAIAAKERLESAGVLGAAAEDVLMTSLVEGNLVARALKDALLDEEQQDLLTSGDADKLAKYLGVEGMQNTARLTGMGMDIAASVSLGNAAGGVVRAATHGAALAAQRGTMSYLWASRLAPAAAEAATEGLYRAGLTALGDDERRRFEEYVKIFGVEAGLDFAASRAFAVAARSGRALGQIFGRGYKGNLAREIHESVTSETIERGLRQPSAGTIDEVGRKQEAWNWQRDQLERISREQSLSELRLHPDDQVIEAAMNTNHVVRRLDDGRWAIWKGTQTSNTPSFVARNTDDAYEKLGNSIIDDIGEEPGVLERLVAEGRPEADFVRVAQRRGVARSMLGEKRVVDAARRDELVKQGAVRGRWNNGVFEVDELGEELALPGRMASRNALDSAQGAVRRSGGELDLDGALARRGYDSYLDGEGRLHLTHGDLQVGRVVGGIDLKKAGARVVGEKQQKANVKQVTESIREGAKSGNAKQLDVALRSLGGEGVEVTTRQADDARKLTQVREVKGKVEVIEGRGPRTVQEQRRLENEAITALRRTGKVDKARVDRVASALAGDAAPRTFKVPFLSKRAKEGFVRHMARELGATRLGQGKYELAGELIEGTNDEVAYRLLLRSYDLPEAQRVLKEQLGAQLSKEGDEYVVRMGRQTIRSRSIEGALEESGYLPTSAGSRFMPRMTLLDNDMPFVEWQGEIVVGSPSRVRRALNALANKPQTTRSVRLRSGKVQVEIPEWGIKQVMNPTEARKYVDGEFKRIENIRDTMSAKQVDVFVDGGAVKFATPEGEVLTARSEQEMQRIMRSIPDPADAPPLLDDAHEEVLRRLQDAMGDQVAPHSKPTQTSFTRKSFRWLTNISMQTGNTDFALERLFKDAGVPEMQVGYRQLETARRFGDAEARPWREMIERIFKGIDREGRERVFHLLNQTSEENMRALGFTLGEVSEAERTAVRELRQMLDGLHRKFGIKQEFLDNYITHVRKAYIDAPEKIRDGWSSPQDIIDYAYKGETAPQQLKFWAESMRKEHFVDFLVETDAKAAMVKYVQRGAHLAHTREAYRVFRDLANKNAAKLGEAGRKRVDLYLQELAGTNYHKGEEAFKRLAADVTKKLMVTPKRVRRIAQEQARRLGGEMTEIDLQRVEAQLTGKAERIGKDALSTFYGLTYFKNLAMKPWMALRNSQQVWTTLAPRYSNKEVLDAIAHLHSDTQNIAEELRRIGVISNRPPIATDATFTGKLQKVTALGMRSFQNSDDYTRAVAYLTATRAMDDAIAGGFVEQGIDAFAKKSGLEYFNKAERELIYDLVKRGDIPTAKRVYGTKVSEDTMFGYRTSQTPAMFRSSGLMKAGGQYGTYSAGYRANILRSLEHATPGGRVKFLAVLVGNSSALAAGAAALGVRYQDFVPGLPGLFGGGPNFELAVNILYSFDAGYKGVEARSELRRGLDPLSFGQVRMLRNAIDQADQGDTFGSIAALGGVPLLD